MYRDRERERAEKAQELEGEKEFKRLILPIQYYDTSGLVCAQNVARAVATHASARAEPGEGSTQPSAWHSVLASDIPSP